MKRIIYKQVGKKWFWRYMDLLLQARIYSSNDAYNRYYTPSNFAPG
jgi:hypothetical protein